MSVNKKIILVITPLVVLIVGILLYRYIQTASVDSFEKCAAQGNPIMESYPARCSANGKTFTQIITNPTTIQKGAMAVSQRENIKVFSPAAGEKVGKSFVITGEARVFENVFQYRVKDSNGEILAKGNGYAESPDVGQYGKFEIQIELMKSSSRGTVEVFNYSAKDGSEEELVVIPVSF